MVEVVCPQCGTETRLDEVRRHADSFCPVCDYPLFWVVDPVGPTIIDLEEAEHRRRLPGVAGKQILVARACWNCFEDNPADGITCVRCGSPLDPPEIVEPPPPVVVEVVAPEPEPATDWTVWVLVGGLLVFVLVAALWVLNTL